MILDSIHNLPAYRNYLGENQKLISCFLGKNQMNIANGDYNLDGDNLYVSINNYYAVDEEEPIIFERHQSHLDLHVLLYGEEKINISHYDHLDIYQDYDSTNDYELLKGDIDISLILKPGFFLLLTPEDAHQVKISTGQSNTQNIKAVFKLRVK